MDKAHWLSRKAASLEMARAAAGSAARLIHYELAGRYSVKAASAAADGWEPKHASAQADPVGSDAARQAPEPMGDRREAARPRR